MNQYGGWHSRYTSLSIRVDSVWRQEPSFFYDLPGFMMGRVVILESLHISKCVSILALAMSLYDDVLPEHENRGCLRRSRTVGLAFLRTVDAVEADAFRGDGMQGEPEIQRGAVGCYPSQPNQRFNFRSHGDPSRIRTPRHGANKRRAIPLVIALSASQQDSSHWLATFQIDNPHSTASKVTPYASVHIDTRGDLPSLWIEIFHAKGLVCTTGQINTVRRRTRLKHEIFATGLGESVAAAKDCGPCLGHHRLEVHSVRVP